MSELTKSVILFSIGILSILLFLDIARTLYLIKKGSALAKSAVPFEQLVPGAEIDILVLGDSTAVGTGAENNTLSTAGRLASRYPNASVKNVSQNGLRLKGLLEIIENLDTTTHYSIILVQIGANDVMRFTSMKTIERDINKVLETLSERTDNLIVLHSGNIGNAPLFQFFARPLLSYRSYHMRDVYIQAAQKHAAKYVDLINSPSETLLKENSTTYYAADRLHLSGAGYGLWFAEIEKVLPSGISGDILK